MWQYALLTSHVCARPPQASGHLGSKLWPPPPATHTGPHGEGGGQTPGTKPQGPRCCRWLAAAALSVPDRAPPRGSHFAPRKTLIPTQHLLFLPLRLKHKAPPTSHSKMFLIITLITLTANACKACLSPRHRWKHCAHVKS